MSAEQAAERLSAAATSLPARLRKKSIRLTRVELVYLPYYFFDITLSHDDGTQLVGVAVDGVVAASLFFVGDTLVRTPGCDGTVCDFAQSASTARETAIDEYRWVLLEHGLRNKRAVSIQEVSEPERVLYPFWVGYFKKGNSYDFRALDAVSGEIQGVKMRKVFLAAFRRMSR